MKKLLLLVVVLSVGAIAEDSNTHSTGAPQSTSTSVVAQPTSQDKSAKLFQYINACMVNRPSSQDDIKKLFQ